MPSFDIVSQLDLHELSNAVDQTSREVSTRFDFKGTSARVEYKDSEITLFGDNEFQLNQVRDILEKKMAKRGIDVAALDPGKLETSAGKTHQPVALRQGIDQQTAKRLVKIIKDAKLKIQASIQGDQVRVNGKKRDDLQQTITMLKEASLGLPLQYINFRD